jgi:hypothetical protein
MLGGIANSKCKMVRNASQRHLLLFTEAEQILKLHCSLCKIGESKPHRAFVKLVEGSVVSKFGIQRFVHFCCKFWRNFDLNSITWNSLEPERARHVGPAVVHARASR